MCLPAFDFDGPYSGLFSSFVNYKRSLGYAYAGRTMRNYRSLNRFLNSRFNGRLVLSEMDFLTWVTPRPDEASAAPSRRAAMFNRFATFMASQGYSAFVATDYRLDYGSDFVPYIYTDKDMKAIFRVVDNLPRRDRQIYDREVMMPVLLRLFYSTGLRHCEATGLKRCDVRLDRPAVNVVGGKNSKDRLVMLSASMATVLGEYLKGVRPREDDAFIFCGKDGRRITPWTLRLWHRDVLKAAGIKRPDGQLPRIHDYRHGFILRSLEQMEDQGLDIYTALPLLSCYVGHRGPKETEYYIRLTDRGRKRIMGVIRSYAPDIIPTLTDGGDDNG
jgi:integrase